MKRNLLLTALATMLGASPLASAQSRPTWFAMPSAPSLRQSPKKVFAHYFDPFGLQINNLVPAALGGPGDYYDYAYLRPDGENGKFAYCGGFIRERPLPVPTAGRPIPDYQYQNLKTEVRRAIMIGLDGFEYDLLSGTGSHWVGFNNMLRAAQEVDPNFKILFKPDMTAGLGGDPGSLYGLLLKIKNAPSLFRLPDGRIVVSPYLPNIQGATFWKNLMTRWSAAGVRVAFVPTFQGWKSNVDLAEWAPFSYGVIQWGSNQSHDNISYKQKYRLKVFGNTVIPQYYRANIGYYKETLGSTLYQTDWKSMIANNVDWVDVATWNDYSEGTEISPSTGIGNSLFEMTAYYATWLKTGKAPTVTEDRVILMQRTQSAISSTFATAPPSISDGVLAADGSQQSRLAAAAFALPTPSAVPSSMVFRTDSPPANVVDVTTFLTAPATIKVKMGDMTYYLDGKAGVNTMQIPLTGDRPNVQIFRNGNLVLQGNGNTVARHGGAINDLLYRGQIMTP